jgi:acetoin utilization deacetylase AcuC-like enzyme
MPTNAARGLARAATSTCRCRAAPASRAGTRRCSRASKRCASSAPRPWWWRSGVDTFEGDPISGFQLRSADYLQVGASLATLGLPTVFTFEGGYAVAEVGVNVANVLEGFAG